MTHILIASSSGWIWVKFWNALTPSLYVVGTPRLASINLNVTQILGKDAKRGVPTIAFCSVLHNIENFTKTHRLQNV
ncbi:hypothetical protein Q7301_09705 [Glaesserella parasuis]|nr:hypothetical protein [Glaesserella parasuis]